MTNKPDQSVVKSLRMKKKDYEMIKKIADERRQGFSSFVRMIIHEWLMRFFK